MGKHLNVIFTLTVDVLVYSYIIVHTSYKLPFGVQDFTILKDICEKRWDTVEDAELL